MEFIELKRETATVNNVFQQVKTNTDFDDPNIFVSGSRIRPDLTIPQFPLQKPIKDYLNKCGITSLSEPDGYHWANLMRRKYLFLSLFLT